MKLGRVRWVFVLAGFIFVFSTYEYEIGAKQIRGRNSGI